MSNQGQLKKEFEEACSEAIMNLGITIGLKSENDYSFWNIHIVGPPNTPYANGIFNLTVEFKDDFKTKPIVKFKTPIYHCNIDSSSGNISMTTLNQWNPSVPMSKILSDIFFLLHNQRPGGNEQGINYSKNRPEFERKAKEWTQKYAMG